MRSNYKKLGKYIQQINNRNTDLNIDRLLGVSINKVLMPSIANTVGTNMKTYKIIKKNQFAYGPVTSRNGDKISIALLQEFDEAILSQAYTVFEVIDETELHPEYLMMWFRRPEFDRYARFKSHGSARETFDWDEMREVELPFPSIEKQREIVKEYNTVVNRMKLNEQLNQKLEETAQALYKQWFVDFEFPNEEGKPYKSSGGAMVYNEELDKEIPEGWEAKSFTKVIKLSGGGTPDTSNEEYWNGEYPFFTPSDINGSYFCINTEKSVTQFGVDNSSTKIYPANTVFVTARGTVGAIAISGRDMTMNQSCYALSGDNSFFVHQTTINTIQKLKNEAIGAVFSALVTKDFNEQFLSYPSNKKILEEKFQQKVSPIYSMILSKIKESSKLDELKDLILSKMTKVEQEKEVAND